MIRLLFLPVLATALILMPIEAPAKEYPHKPVNLSLFYPIATSQDPTISTSFRLNLTYSHVGELRGFDINGLVSRIDRDLRWVQFTGLYSHVGGDMEGIALTGVVNYVGGSATGGQVAGLVNYDRGEFDGIQFAGLFNFTEEGFDGIQLSTVFNLNNGDGGFLQWGTFANATAGSFSGLQISTGVNFVNQDIVGAQIGFTNFATEFRGIQLGAFNATRNANGPQIGILNIARENNSVPVGFMSFTDSSNTDWVSFGSSFAAFNTGVRTAVRGWYSMFTAGVGDLDDERDDTAFFTWNYGYAFALGAGGGERWSLAPDLGFVHIMPQPSDTKLDNQQFAVQARLLLEYRFSPRVSAFAGGGVSTRFSEYSTDAVSKTDPLGLLGVSLF